MKTNQDYIRQVFVAHKSMLNRYYGIANIEKTVKQFTTHLIMLHIAYDMIMKGEY